MVTLFSVVMGAHVGYGAASPGEAHVHYNGSHVDTGTEPPVAVPHPAETGSGAGSEPLPATHRWLMSGLHHIVLTYAMGVADIAAQAFYHIGQAVPLSVTEVVLEGAAWAGIVPVALEVNRRLGGVFR